MADHDYICSVCAGSFSLTGVPEDPPGDTPEDAPVACPACGSPLVRETWESRLRNSPGPPKPIEEMRDCVG